MSSLSAFRRLLTNVFQNSPSAPTKRRSPLGNVEQLEDRTVPAAVHPLNDGDPVADGFTSGGVSNHSRGWRFQANADVYVVELGANNPIPAGNTFSVTLWDSDTQAQLARVDIVSDGPGTWQWQTLETPVHLLSGHQYIVSQFSTTSNYYFRLFSPGSPWLPTGTIQYLDMRYANGATVDTFPTSTLTNYQYGVPDIGYVDNSPPTSVNAGGPYIINEGDPVTLTGSATDPDSDPLTYSWDINGDGIFGDATGANPTLTWAQLSALSPPINHFGVFNVSVQVSDGVNSPVTSAPTTLTVNEVKKFDMKASVSAPAVEGWDKAWQGTKYNATTGYGWSQSSSVGGGANGVVPPESNKAVMGDYAYGATAATFQVKLEPFQTATVKIYSYGTAAQGKPGVAAKIGNGPTSTLTTNGVLEITGQTDANGILNITFNKNTGKAMWVVSAIEVTPGDDRK